MCFLLGASCVADSESGSIIKNKQETTAESTPGDGAAMSCTQETSTNSPYEFFVSITEAQAGNPGSIAVRTGDSTANILALEYFSVEQVDVCESSTSGLRLETETTGVFFAELCGERRVLFHTGISFNALTCTGNGARALSDFANTHCPQPVCESGD